MKSDPNGGYAFPFVEPEGCLRIYPIATSIAASLSGRANTGPEWKKVPEIAYEIADALIAHGHAKR